MNGINPEGYAPIIVFVFGDDPIPTEETVRDLLHKDERFRRIIIRQVAGMQDAIDHFINERTPWRMFLSRSAPDRCRSVFVGFTPLPESNPTDVY
ncbi:hypothetical protein HGA91_00180 [candidate division WWE3 bacterium]|nr:hypothetical protein [candidate division WWE3 bacterium]